MTKRALTSVVAIAFVLSGCAADRTRSPHGRTTQPCDRANCQIDVMVVGTPPQVRAVDELWVKKGNNPPNGILLVWHLSDSDARYEFRDDSIQFYEGNNTLQFTRVGPQGAGKQYHYRNRNTDEHKYGYMIKVYDKTNDNWFFVDPFVWNGR